MNIIVRVRVTIKQYVCVRVSVHIRMHTFSCRRASSSFLLMSWVPRMSLSVITKSYSLRWFNASSSMRRIDT